MRAGTGKTAMMRNMLAGMDGESVTSTTINLNSYSDAPSTQPILENPLEKKSGDCRVLLPIAHEAMPTLGSTPPCSTVFPAELHDRYCVDAKLLG